VSSDLEALGVTLKAAVAGGEMMKDEAIQRYQQAASASKSKPSRCKAMSGPPFPITGFYMGGKTRADGEFEAAQD